MWAFILLWLSASGLAAVGVYVAHLAGSQRDDMELVEQHRRQMRALDPGARR